MLSVLLLLSFFRLQRFRSYLLLFFYFSFSFSAEPSTAPFAEPSGFNPAEKVKPTSDGLHDYGRVRPSLIHHNVQRLTTFRSWMETMTTST